MEAAPKKLELYCVVKEEGIPFPVEIFSNKSICSLKNAIKKKKEKALGNWDANQLTLKLIKNGGVTKKGLGKLSEQSLKPLDDELEKLHAYFPAAVDESRIYIIVEVPQQAMTSNKRDAEEEEEEEGSFKNLTSTFVRAITNAGFAEKAIVRRAPMLSALDQNERVAVLRYLGMGASPDSSFGILLSTVLDLKSRLKESGEDFSSLETISSSHGTLPIVFTESLYIRDSYKLLYNTITSKFTDHPNTPLQNRIVVTGTSGIGKSAFLVYFIVRLLINSDNSKPPIIIFHEKQGSNCFVFGGTSIVCHGAIEIFNTLLDLNETWYLSDSSENPVLNRSKVIILASPKRLLLNYQEAMKEVSWTYYLAPWSRDELEQCRNSVKCFNIVEFDLMEKLFNKVGGIPRYVLQKPMVSHNLGRDLALTEDDAYSHIEEALGLLDNPAKLIDCFCNTKESIELSNRILHRWPTSDHSSFEFRWASQHIQMEAYRILDNQSWVDILKEVVRNPTLRGRGSEEYVSHIFRKGGHTFQIRELKHPDSNSNRPAMTGLFHVPLKPPVVIIHDHNFSILSSLAQANGTLYAPDTFNFPCIDLALGPNHLIQITLADKHPIKHNSFKKMVETIRENNNDVKLRLYFLVDKEFDNFTYQNYVTLGDTVVDNISPIVRTVEQYALKFDLSSASKGESPGIQINQNRSIVPASSSRTSSGVRHSPGIQIDQNRSIVPASSSGTSSSVRRSPKNHPAPSGKASGR